MPARYLALITLALLGSCARPQLGDLPSREGPTGGGPCLLSTGDVTSRASTITIGLIDAVNPRHAPAPRTDAERLVFRHLYETPVRIDCGAGNNFQKHFLLHLIRAGARHQHAAWIQEL